MTIYADDGFGNLLDAAPQRKTTIIRTRINATLARFECRTGDHEKAIRAVRESLCDVRLSQSGKWKNGPVLAILTGGPI